ncbi:MAG: tRNA pseudouridine(13) synthase TruD [Gammaproteobacteria bacterium]|nr:MAG: tRNA pseudouridine(13) synthase TruD [Gammaproteobacteria bacterium]
MLSPYITDCRLWPVGLASATFKSQPTDFVVDEILQWDFKGRGEHIFLYIEKTNCNTAWVAKQLARFYGVPPRDVGYSGLKDRHAVTRQYFSIRLPGVKPDSYDLPEHDEYRVVSHTLHDKKLKRGNHPYNDFVIRLRQIEGDRALIDERLAFIRDHGSPNLFDTQRFGHDNNNLRHLEQWVKGELDVRKRDEKGRLLSAFRSALFNRQLGMRIADDSWQQIVAGDTVMLAGTNSFFVAETVDEALIQRAKAQDIHPAGTLVGHQDHWGDIDGLDSDALRELMRREHLNTGYRPLRLRVENLSWAFEGDDCVVSMRLPTGGYASGVIHQVFETVNG